MGIEQFILVEREPWVSTDDTVYPRNTRISLDALHVGIELADIINGTFLQEEPSCAVETI